jgi:hypothetical protein
MNIEDVKNKELRDTARSMLGRKRQREAISAARQRAVDDTAARLCVELSRDENGARIKCPLCGDWFELELINDELARIARPSRPSSHCETIAGRTCDMLDEIETDVANAVRKAVDNFDYDHDYRPGES